MRGTKKVLGGRWTDVLVARGDSAVSLEMRSGTCAPPSGAATDCNQSYTRKDHVFVDGANVSIAASARAPELLPPHGAEERISR